MTAAQWNERLPAIQAFCEGKPIQVKAVSSVFGWNDFSAVKPAFEEPALEWRPKPEPRKLYAVFDRNGVFREARDGLSDTQIIQSEMPGSTIISFTEDTP
jgi:hypothetical protein